MATEGELVGGRWDPPAENAEVGEPIDLLMFGEGRLGGGWVDSPCRVHQRKGNGEYGEYG